MNKIHVPTMRAHCVITNWRCAKLPHFDCTDKIRKPNLLIIMGAVNKILQRVLLILIAYYGFYDIMIRSASLFEKLTIMSMSKKHKMQTNLSRIF